jgi:hypothetical protein
MNGRRRQFGAARRGTSRVGVAISPRPATM